MVLVYKRQHMPTEANSVLKRETITKSPCFYNTRGRISTLDFHTPTSETMTERQRKRETSTSQNHKSNTCPLLTLMRLADYKDTVNGVILTQQWEGAEEGSTPVPGQGARLSCRPASHLPWLIGDAGCRSRRTHGGRIWGWLIALSSEPRVGSSGVLGGCKYTWAQSCTSPGWNE